jgi:(p)ppGpp synthase/HD superfamily hydrolase
MQTELIKMTTERFSKFHQAFSFANMRHQGQKIPGSELPYISHISSVCFELLLLPDLKKYDMEFLLCVASLHDILEDTLTTEEELSELFGSRVLSAVKALSKDYSLPKESQIADSLERVLMEPIEVHLVKLADRICNLEKPPSTWTRDKTLRYHESSKLIYEKLKSADEHLSSKLSQKIKNYNKFW